MISEPELSGGPEGPGPDLAGDVAEADGWGQALRGGRRGWVWGLAGIVVASAGWAGGLQAYHSHHGSGPDMHGYALGASPCAGGTLSPLTDALELHDAQAVSPAAVHLGEALDQIRCTLSGASPLPHGGTARYEVFVTIDLHKRTDPKAEFEDQRDLNPSDISPVEATTTVPGLGDEAYLLTVSDQTRDLEVLHGGAVFTLTLTGYNRLPVSDDTVNALHTPDVSADVGRFQPAMVDAMRRVMKDQERG
ncbi:hypothetical protein V2S66_04720 [Streptomyces sp. V4-01]|uniref:DUF5642 domain-containing protein n=1 Tax=Actinacidiphila polyblastidii TaxID=3110430 RepID=A0ABU7P621_9ACTN|nr:hypothetical protein [Streptomyces sp. V4-01]